ncbi:MAG: zinc ribbon domain-containing protein, partial [Pirellulaceae bacterium]|nr:zinc ribbon domain-containing protein [Pirellulaceae bacterium]
MELVICPTCHTRVAAKADGSCPSCQAPLHDAEPAFKSKKECPSCGAKLPPHAVLCVACGYHLKTGVHLATASSGESPAEPPTSYSEPSQDRISSPAINPNPYAPPLSESLLAENNAAQANTAPLGEIPERCLRKAERIAESGASYMAAVLLILCLGPIGMLALPWYIYCLVQWYELRRQYPQLLLGLQEWVGAVRRRRGSREEASAAQLLNAFLNGPDDVLDVFVGVGRGQET